MQIIGTLLGAVINYILMTSITTNQREILLSIQGTNIWSGQVIQSFNSNVGSTQLRCHGTQADVYIGYRFWCSLRVHVQRRSDIQLDRSRSTSRLPYPGATLLAPSSLSDCWFRLHCDPPHLLVPGLFVRGNQLVCWDILCNWLLHAVLGQEETPKVVPQVQLSAGRCYQWRN